MTSFLKCAKRRRHHFGPQKICMNDDEAHWQQLMPRAKIHSWNLRFFAASDGIVVENLISRFASEVQVPEARCFYGFQTAIENIHSEVLVDDSQICKPKSELNCFVLSKSPGDESESRLGCVHVIGIG